jgi:hypothetical protein
MKLSNFLVLYISSSSLREHAQQFYFVTYLKKRKIEENTLFGTERPGMRRELCPIFADEF